MPIKFSCGACGKKFAAKDEDAGRQSKCPACGWGITVPWFKPEDLEDRPKPVPPPPAPSEPPPAPVKLLSVAPPPPRPELPELPNLPVAAANPTTMSRSFLAIWTAAGALGACVVLVLGYWVLSIIGVVASPMATREIVDRSEASVAQIKGRGGSGTGFLVGNGVLVTNAHVISVELARDVEAHFSAAPEKAKGPHKVRILYEDPKQDLALLKIDSALPPLRLARSYVFRRGDDVTIIGNPGVGPEIVLQNAITRGVLSTETTLNGRRVYQLGASINPGNSGGPVLGSDGSVIGVACAKAANAEAVGFCVPVKELESALAIVANLKPQDSDRAEKNHNARVVFLRIVVAGVLYQSSLDTYVSSMSRSINSGRSADDGLASVFKECAANAAGVSANMERDVRPVLSALVRDNDIPEGVRRDLVEFWAVCSDMRFCVEEPRGNYNSFRARVVDLKDRFDHLAASLRVSVGAAD